MGPVEQSIVEELASSGFRERVVSAGGGVVRVLEGGDGAGPPLVLLHGRGSAATMWLPLLPLLARAHRVLAVDLPGFGASTGHRFGGRLASHPPGPPMPPGPAGSGPADALAFFAEPLAAWLAAEGVVRPVLAGHSLGGAVALELALRGVAPAALVLVASMAVGPEMTYAGRLFFHAGPERLARLLGPRAVARLVPSPGPEGPRLSALSGELLAVPGGRPDAAAAFDTLVPLVGPLPHLGARLPEIDAPALVLWGDRDEVLPAPLAIAASASLPRAVLRIEQAGHSPHLEDPTRTVAVLDDFLARIG